MDKDSKLNLQVTAVIWGIGLVILFLGLIFNRKALWVRVLCIASAIPCNAPQIINVHPAPCHSPPIRKVESKFTYVLALPFLFPPRGI